MKGHSAECDRRRAMGLLTVCSCIKPKDELQIADYLDRLPQMLRRAREHRGLSLRQAATEIGLASDSTVHRIESDKGCSIRTAVAVLRWLGGYAIPVFETCPSECAELNHPGVEHETWRTA